MAPPTAQELANRERLVRQAVARLDPQGLTPPILREVIVDAGTHNTEVGGALIQASMGMPQQGQQWQQGQQGQGQGHGRGRGQGQGQN